MAVNKLGTVTPRPALTARPLSKVLYRLLKYSSKEEVMAVKKNEWVNYEVDIYGSMGSPRFLAGHLYLSGKIMQSEQ